MKTEYFKVPCPIINVVLSVKKYPIEELDTLYNTLKAKIEAIAFGIEINKYITVILKHFLVDYDKFEKCLMQALASSRNVEEEEKIIKESVYEQITHFFPAFSIENMCGSINSELFLSSYGGSKSAQVSTPEGMMSEKPSNIGTFEDLEKLKRWFSNKIIGQEEAINEVIDGIKLISAKLDKRTSFFFLGPTGVGKSELAKLVGKKYSGNFLKINCAEYAGGHEYAKLIGAPPGYIGHTDKSLLKEKADKSNRWVFLWDEIEKAHDKLFNFLLSLLEDGTVTDSTGKELDFSQSIHIFTSNQGLKDLKSKMVGFSERRDRYAESHELITDSVKKIFSPEFLNRIDHMVFFNQLSEDDIKKIIHNELKVYPIERSKDLVNLILKEAYSEEYGAREIRRYIKKNVATKVADALLSRLVPKNKDLYKTQIVDNKITIVDTMSYADSKANKAVST